jgi:DNA invertase Pin-like site-specific DNA recombinase
MLTVLAGLAQFDKELIKARTDEGRKRAMAKGVQFGRPVKLRRSSGMPTASRWLRLASLSTSRIKASCAWSQLPAKIVLRL